MVGNIGSETVCQTKFKEYKANGLSNSIPPSNCAVHQHRTVLQRFRLLHLIFYAHPH